MRMKKHLSTILLVVVLLAGLSLLLYPTVANFVNSRNQTRAIATYREKLETEVVSYEADWAAARDYNRRLMEKGAMTVLSDSEKQEYESLLNLGGNGIMGYIEIPKINIRLPLYHGTSEGVLQIAIGHIENTSLPTGGMGTHCAVSGHRGLPSARLFTDLDQMAVGDRFMMHVLDETLTYEVDQILVVLPHETEALAIDPMQDYCTLVTCTPYGINSHRMLVRGHRVETVAQKPEIEIMAEAEQIDEKTVIKYLAIPAAVLLFVSLLLPTKKKR